MLPNKGFIVCVYAKQIHKSINYDAMAIKIHYSVSSWHLRAARMRQQFNLCHKDSVRIKQRYSGQLYSESYPCW